MVAADFSQGMLDMLNRDLAALGLASRELVDVKLMSWEDDWEACGVGPKSVDVALASRSMATPDIARALEALSRTARKRVFGIYVVYCLFVKFGSSGNIST